MATTKIWSIKGRLSSVINYAANPDKTVNPKFSEDDLQGLRDVMNYAVNDFKTEKQFFVTGINCQPSFARQQMIETKKHYEKTDGIIAFHAYQSFAPGEVTPELAHIIGCKLAEKLWGDRFEVVVATHLNAHCIHNHFVLNSVSLSDGKKFNACKQSYKEMRKVSDELCEKQNLSVIYQQEPTVKRCYPSAISERDGGYTKNEIFKRDIDECIRLSSNMNNFYSEMKKLGYSFDFTHKYATLSHPNFPKARRLKNLGEDYTEKAIKERVLRNYKRGEPDDTEQENPEDIFFNGDIENFKTVVGYRATYVRYVYGVKIVMERPTSNRRMLFLLMDDIIKLDKLIAENNLICDNNIDTAEQFDGFIKSAKSELEELTNARIGLRNNLLSAVRSGNEEGQKEYREHITVVSARIQKLRRELKTADGVRERYPHIKETLSQIEKEIRNDKEVNKNELIRRCSRTNRENVT